MRNVVVALTCLLGVASSPRVLAGGVVDRAAADARAAILAAAPSCDPARIYCFEIALHVASARVSEPGADGDALVASPAFFATQLAAANAHFARLDTGFQLASIDVLPATTAHIKTRADRNALARHGGGRVLDVFLTGALDDIDTAGKQLNGVAWRGGGRKVVIVSARAWERTLAHELGHVFGLPHSSYPISIMNKTPRDDPPPEVRTFADEEYARMQEVRDRLVRTKVLANRRR